MNQYSSLSNENFEGNNSEHIHDRKPSDFENKPISICHEKLPNFSIRWNGLITRIKRSYENTQIELER